MRKGTGCYYAQVSHKKNSESPNVDTYSFHSMQFSRPFKSQVGYWDNFMIQFDFGSQACDSIQCDIDSFGYMQSGTDSTVHVNMFSKEKNILQLML